MTSSTIGLASGAQYLYYVWPNYANGASGVYTRQSNLPVTGNAACPVDVQVTWTAVAGASSYTVYRGPGSAGSLLPGIIATAPFRLIVTRTPSATVTAVPCRCTLPAKA